MSYDAKIILDSIGPNGSRLTTFELSYPRFVHAELMTHRMFCLAGDARLDFDMPSGQGSGARKVHSMTIAEFVGKWKHGSRPHRSRWGGERTYDLKPRLREMRIRQLNEATGEIETSTVFDACESGTKPVYEVQAGSYVVAGSADHRVMTSEGWKAISEIRIGDELVVSTRKKPEELKADPVRLKKINGRWRSTWQREQRAKLRSADPICRECRKCDGTEVHHLVSVYEAPGRAFDETNVTLVCDPCHDKKHERQGWQVGAPLYAGLATVSGMKYRGIESTYDLSISGPFPNFLANKIVVHNSRNAASSRAIPTEKLLDRIEKDPVLPVWWGKNQSGMQAREELSNERGRDEGMGRSAISSKEDARQQWLAMCGVAIEGVRTLERIGLHKQVSNRPLEAWMFITVIVTATEWSNFFALRDHADAQPELAACAKKAHALYRESKPRKLTSGEWHLPYVTGNDESELRGEGFEDDRLCLISTGRCARVSYLTHDGVRDPLADVALAQERILPSGHMSPFEHPAQAMNEAEWQEYTQQAMVAWALHRVPPGNFWGWRQLRKELKNEHDFGLLVK